MEFYIPTSRRWYVDPVNGNDGNDGSYSLPFATINAAIAIANHGDEIFGMPGTYAEAISTHSGGSILNFIGVDPNLCIISGSQSGRLVWLQRGSRFCNWTVNNVGNGNGQGIGFDDFSNSVIEDVIRQFRRRTASFLRLAIMGRVRKRLYQRDLGRPANLQYDRLRVPEYLCFHQLYDDTGRCKYAWLPCDHPSEFWKHWKPLSPH